MAFFPQKNAPGKRTHKHKHARMHTQPLIPTFLSLCLPGAEASRLFDLSFSFRFLEETNAYLLSDRSSTFADRVRCFGSPFQGETCLLAFCVYSTAVSVVICHGPRCLRRQALGRMWMDTIHFAPVGTMYNRWFIPDGVLSIPTPPKATGLQPHMVNKPAGQACNRPPMLEISTLGSSWAYGSLPL